MTKSEQRREIQAAVKAMTQQERCDASDAICTQLSSITSLAVANTILAYLPLPDEVDLCPLLTRWMQEQRTICVPLVSWGDATMRAGQLTSLDDAALVKTRHGIREPLKRYPVPEDAIDAILVPGVGFDASGWRLGRGGGYYDRFLALIRPPVVIGIAFECQILQSVCREEHDQCMDIVVTPTTLLL